MLALARADAEIPSGPVLPKKRIAKASEQRVIGWLENGPLPFFPCAKFGVGGGGEALYFAEVVYAVAKRGVFGSNRPYAGVDQRWRAMVVHGAAGEATIGVAPSRGRRERHGQMTPMNHIRTDGVRPMHVSPAGGVGVVLKKHVVAAFPVHGPVRVIHPIARGKEMKLRTQGVGGKSLPQGLGRQEGR